MSKYNHRESIPLLEHSLGSPASFTPEALVEAVRLERGLAREPVPQVCVLEFDGDLTDWLVSQRKVSLCRSWACFHTTMFLLDVNGIPCGIVPRTIGGPYAVLVAEQMAISGARVVLGLTSAGRVSSSMPVPGLVCVTRAVRDEGTSYHYLSPNSTVDAQPDVAELLESELVRESLVPVRSGTVWTTDAPYRETKEELDRHAGDGVLAVEMQAASLFAFSSARRFPVGVVAHVTNSAGETAFDKGAHTQEAAILEAICRAGQRYVPSL